MKYLSLFSGIGGFELGIQQAYESLCNAHGSEDRGGKEDTEGDKGQGLLTETGQDIGAQERPVGKRLTDRLDQRPLCIGYSEIDKYAIETYQSHFPNHKNYGDITKINEKELPDFDLIVGGFPCQSFSIAGKRGGFNDTRGTLFFDIARIIKEKQPRLLLLENVKGLLSHDEGRTFATIIATLDELGYDLQWQVLNSKNHGVPQNRERVFIIGHLRGTSRPKVFPFGDDTEKTPELSGQHSNTLTARYYGGQANGTYVLESEQYAQKINVFDLKATPNSTRRGKVSNNSYAKTLDRDCLQGVESGVRIRRLTPIECERLQGFPDNWTIGSDTQRYKQCGNAVTVKVIQDIAQRLLSEHLNK